MVSNGISGFSRAAFALLDTTPRLKALKTKFATYPEK